jgi:hypothetical protein
VDSRDTTNPLKAATAALRGFAVSWGHGFVTKRPTGLVLKTRNDPRLSTVRAGCFTPSDSGDLVRRPVLLMTAGAMILAGCTDAPRVESADAGSSPSSSAAPAPSQAAPVTEDPLVGDQALVRSLYYDHTQAFARGLEVGTTFIAEHNHPQTPYSAEECLMSYSANGITEAYTVSAVPDVTAMALDPGWALPGGKYTGAVPDGRIYILPVAETEFDPDAGIDFSGTSQVHVAILDGSAYYFKPCEQL